MQPILDLSSFSFSLFLIAMAMASNLLAMASDLLVLYLASCPFPRAKQLKKLRDKRRSQRTGSVETTCEMPSYAAVINHLTTVCTDIYIYIYMRDCVYSYTYIYSIYNSYMKSNGFCNLVVSHSLRMWYALDHPALDEMPCRLKPVCANCEQVIDKTNINEGQGLSWHCQAWFNSFQKGFHKAYCKGCYSICSILQIHLMVIGTCLDDSASIA